MDYQKGYQRMDGSHNSPPLPEYPSGPSISVLPEYGGGEVYNTVPSEVSPKASKAFTHVSDLDVFFRQVYKYHQRNGYFCMMLQESLEVFQFLYVVIFSTFLLECVDYDILFANKIPESWRPFIEPSWWNASTYGHKVTIGDAVIPTGQCVKHFGSGVTFMILLATAFWLWRLAKVSYNFFSYAETRRFYRIALKIEDHELSNLTWHEVLQRLLAAQKTYQMCRAKTELTELDVYHRILRVENFLISMVNKQTVPVKVRLPFLGQATFLSKSYLWNLELILFWRWGFGSLFEQKWTLRDEFKVYGRRLEVAEKLRRRIGYFALVNLLLCPFVLVFRVLYAFFNYADVIKRDPSSLGTRRWSSYAKLYLRHFNEVDHELIARLNRAHRPATQYMNIFTSPVLTILAKNVAFVAGSLLAVLVICTVLDEDVLKVAHMLTTLTLLGIIVAACRACIPDENAVYNPEVLMSSVISEIHYAPETWKGRAHTSDVRNEFANLFHLRFSHMFEELLSPIATPLLLYTSLRDHSLQIVDFFRNFTVDLVGVGDVCSFAQMDIRKHGDPEWTPDTLIDPDRMIDDDHQRADHGKTEMSLIHFKLTNPEWKPPQEAQWFMQKLKEEVEKGAQSGGHEVLASLVPLGGRARDFMAVSRATGDVPVGQVSSREGALSGSVNNGGLLETALSNSNMERSVLNSFTQSQLASPLEMTAADMSFSALFMHELHRRRIRESLHQYGSIREGHDTMEASVTQRTDSSRHFSTVTTTTNVTEEDEGTPLLDLKK